jgi:hypothetical protein
MSCRKVMISAPVRSEITWRKVWGCVKESAMVVGEWWWRRVGNELGDETYSRARNFQEMMSSHGGLCLDGRCSWRDKRWKKKRVRMLRVSLLEPLCSLSVEAEKKCERNGA